MILQKQGDELDTIDRPVIAVRDLTVVYDGDLALRDITFAVNPGDSVAIIGPNGAGKSTLIQAIMGLLQARSGDIMVDDPQRLGYVPQHEAVNLDFPVTVRDVVMMGRARRIGWLRWPGRADQTAVETALARVGMGAYAHRQIGDLSGGQRQRVFVARALAQEAAVLILDEPFSGVDASAQAAMMAVLDALHTDGLTIILCTHDLNLAFQRFDRVLALKERVIAYGPPAAVYTREILAQLYGGRLTTLENGQQVTVFVDDHNCC